MIISHWFFLNVVLPWLYACCSMDKHNNRTEGPQPFLNHILLKNALMLYIFEVIAVILA